MLPITPINTQSRSFALHPVMGTLQTMFNTDRRLAIVPNMGPLPRPTTKAQYGQASCPKPASHFSHKDQQNTWQALGAEGVTRGWGGRTGDALAALNTCTAFTSVSAAGNALRHVDTTLGALNARNSVTAFTAFTASDFGRTFTFTSNGDGTDHGWGSHHLVMGGAVKGGDLYGRSPTVGLTNSSNNNRDSSSDQLGNGAMLPEQSMDHLGASLGRWFGVSDTGLADIFPKLANFDAAKRDLGFMG